MQFFYFARLSPVFRIRKIFQVIILTSLVVIVASSFHVQLAWAADTLYVEFSVDDEEQSPAFDASVLLTTDNGKKIQIDFENPIRQGTSDRVSLVDRQLKVVTVKYQWKHVLNLTHFAERKAAPGKYFDFSSLRLNDFINSDRDVSVRSPERDL